MDGAATLRQAQQAVEEGDLRTALARLRVVLRYPGPLDASWEDALRVLVALTDPGSPVAAPLARVQADRSDPQALYELGYALVEGREPALASGVLRRANTYAPGQEPIVTELVTALEEDGLNEEAVDVLRRSGLADASVFCRYLYAFNLAMAGRIGQAAEQLPALSVSSDPQHRAWAERVGRMVARAEAVSGATSLDWQDLRGWHFVLTGGILLHRSPFGFDQGMLGRYAYTEDSPGRIRAGLERLGGSLRALDRLPSRVLGLGARESRILGRAAATVLGLPYQDLSDPEQSGLLVSYDLALETPAQLQALRRHRPQQPLFAHVASWTSPPPVVPDLVMLLAQYTASPWGRRLGQVLEDERPDELVAQELAATEPELQEVPGDAESLAQLLLQVQGAGLYRDAGVREPFWYGGPVKSSRFV